MCRQKRRSSSLRNAFQSKRPTVAKGGRHSLSCALRKITRVHVHAHVTGAAAWRMEAVYFKREQTIRGARVLLFTDNEAITPRNRSRSKGKYHVAFQHELAEVCARTFINTSENRAGKQAQGPPGAFIEITVIESTLKLCSVC